MLSSDWPGKEPLPLTGAGAGSRGLDGLVVERSVPPEDPVTGLLGAGLPVEGGLPGAGLPVTGGLPGAGLPVEGLLGAGLPVEGGLPGAGDLLVTGGLPGAGLPLSLIHISEPTRLALNSYAVFCLKKKNIV